MDAEASSTTTRHTDTVDLDDASEGDRIAPELIPPHLDVDVGDRVEDYLASPLAEDDNRTFDVRVVKAENQPQSDIEHVLVYDPTNDLYARLSATKSQQAMSQQERDYKIREIGGTVEVNDIEDYELTDEDLADETPEEYSATWLEIVLDEIEVGRDVPDDIRGGSRSRIELEDWDGRKATVTYSLSNDE